MISFANHDAGIFLNAPAACGYDFINSSLVELILTGVAPVFDDPPDPYNLSPVEVVIFCTHDAVIPLKELALLFELSPLIELGSNAN